MCRKIPEFSDRTDVSYFSHKCYFINRNSEFVYYDYFCYFVLPMSKTVSFLSQNTEKSETERKLFLCMGRSSSMH
jgi:hypothetical protein